MIDPSAAQVRIQQLVRENEELLGYMSPSKKQTKQIKQNAVEIAFLALSINDFYKGELEK